MLHSFVGADGAEPRGRIVLSGQTIYGTTHWGGCFQKGTVFKLNTDGSGYAVLKHFSGEQGAAYPVGGLVMSGQTLYGMTSAGGTSNLGTVFRINTDGTGYGELKSYSGADGAKPASGLTLSGTNLFGATYYGGISNSGVVFQLGSDGSDYAVLRQFTDMSNGWAPRSDPVISGSMLYGTTEYGGTTNVGTVFALDTGNRAFAVLKSFQRTDGQYPMAGLALLDGTLFGVTPSGGASQRGAVFRLQPDGSGFEVLKSFTGGDGANPWAALISTGPSLCGTTFSGGNSNLGTVFQIDTSGSNYAVLKHFTGTDGANPKAPLTVSGTTLFGTTSAGGAYGYGALFALSVPGDPSTVAVAPRDQIVLAGTTASLVVRAAGLAPLHYQWYHNGDPVNGAVGSVLQLTNVQLSHAGSYSVVITNTAGAATSAVAILSVVLPGTVPVATCTETALRAALAGPGPVTFACDGTIQLSSTISITNDTVLDGSGHQVTLSGGGLTRIFSIATNVTLTLRNLTVANGVAHGDGGAVYNPGGTLAAEQCVFWGNIACQPPAEPGTNGVSAYGGAIYNSGTVNATGCAFLGNQAVGGRGAGGLDGTIMTSPSSGWYGGAGCGGAIYNAGLVVVDRSLFATNLAAGGAGGMGGNGTHVVGCCSDQPGGLGGDGGSGEGAALFNVSTAIVANCTFFGNTNRGGLGGGGGIGGVFTFHPSGGEGQGFSGGSGGTGGDALNAIYQSGGPLYLCNCTVSLNSAVAGNGGAKGPGSLGAPDGQTGADGFAVAGIKAELASLVNTLLATNSPGGNSAGTPVDLGHNLSSDASCAFTNIGSMNNTHPMLGPLANNGGPTLTMALLPGSPAIDAGNMALAPATDQRGFPRPAGLAADIGAFEYGSAMPTLAISRSGATGLNILGTGNAGQSCRLLSSPDLTNWVPIATNQTESDGTVLFYDTCAPGSTCRFYRLVMP